MFCLCCYKRSWRGSVFKARGSRYLDWRAPLTPRKGLLVLAVAAGGLTFSDLTGADGHCGFGDVGVFDLATSISQRDCNRFAPKGTWYHLSCTAVFMEASLNIWGVHVGMYGSREFHHKAVKGQSAGGHFSVSVNIVRSHFCQLSKQHVANRYERRRRRLVGLLRTPLAVPAGFGRVPPGRF